MRSHNVTGVDFKVNCGVGTTSGGSSQCPLDVSAKLLEPLRSGLAVHSIHYNLYPVDFISHGGNGFACESGCSEVRVTVLDPATHTPVANATVDAKLSGTSLGQQTLADGRVVTPPAAGHEWVCETDASGSVLSNCGMSTLSGLTSDSRGNVYLRYFTPGVVAPADAKLTLDATACSTPCTAKRTGNGQLGMTTAPYLIYQHSGDLSPEGVKTLSEWASGGQAFTKFLEKSTQGFNLLKNALKTLEVFEAESEGAVALLKRVEQAEPVFLPADIILSLNTYAETQAMVALFLNNAGLSAIGLGDPASEASVSGGASNVFSNALVNQILAPEFLKVGNGGWWWAAANIIKKAESAGELGGRWGLKVDAYEVSNCIPTDGDCGPGYANTPGFSQVLRGGIKPELAFELTLTHRVYVPKLHKGLVSSFEDGFVVPYDAIAWTETQANIAGRIQDFLH